MPTIYRGQEISGLEPTYWSRSGALVLFTRTASIVHWLLDQSFSDQHELTQFTYNEPYQSFGGLEVLNYNKQ